MPPREWIITGAGLVFCFVAGLGFGLFAQADAGEAGEPTPRPSATSGPTSDGPAPADDTAVPTAPPSPFAGELLAYGDSILILAESCLAERGFAVDSEESRPVGSGPEELLAYGDALPERILIHLGTNGGAAPEDYDAIMDVLGPDRVVVFATIQLPNDYDRYTFEDRTNEAITALPQRYPNVRIFDWHTVSDLNGDWLYDDGFHPNPEGCDAYASLAEEVIRAA